MSGSSILCTSKEARIRLCGLTGCEASIMSDRRQRAKRAYGVLLLISLLWLGAIFAAPWLMAEEHRLVSIIFYRAFSTVCHQIPDRSFYFHGFPLGVCSRCTG